MVYISNRRGFKDFFKSRNTKFYIAIMIIFIAVVITTAIIIHKAKKYNDDKHNISDTASEIFIQNLILKVQRILRVYTIFRLIFQIIL